MLLHPYYPAYCKPQCQTCAAFCADLRAGTCLCIDSSQALPAAGNTAAVQASFFSATCLQIWEWCARPCISVGRAVHVAAPSFALLAACHLPAGSAALHLGNSPAHGQQPGSACCTHCRSSQGERLPCHQSADLKALSLHAAGAPGKLPASSSTPVLSADLEAGYQAAHRWQLDGGGRGVHLHDP